MSFLPDFCKFWLITTFLHLAGDSIGRVSRVSLPAGGAHQACRSLGQSLGRNPIGEPNLIPPSVTSCRAEQRGEILGGHSKDTEVWEAQVVWDVGHGFCMLWVLGFLGHSWVSSVEFG